MGLCQEGVTGLLDHYGIKFQQFQHARDDGGRAGVCGLCWVLPHGSWLRRAWWRLPWRGDAPDVAHQRVRLVAG
jgi:hypothetical protein